MYSRRLRCSQRSESVVVKASSVTITDRRRSWVYSISIVSASSSSKEPGVTPLHS